MALSVISAYTEAAAKFISDLAKDFREKRWVKILSLIGVVFAVILNPASAKYGLELSGFNKPEWYSYLTWGLLTGTFFVGAFVVALLTKEKKKRESLTTASIIKGLLPYTSKPEDAEWFAKLQRENTLKDCLRFCDAKDLYFGVISGESGAGKTSFLQAGLVPILEKQHFQPIYIKFTDSAPIDSIHLALGKTESEGIFSEGGDFFLNDVAGKNNQPILLIFDQFEQFFVHHKTKALRRKFILQMAEWYKQRRALSIKILISIRGDFANRLNEFQKEMKYTLAAHNNITIEKFEPREAVKVINVIAEEANIEYDANFVREFTKNQLADREDGTVSPVDIQILSWMLDGQKGSGERAFNRQAFQKLGGVEGLLERFLNRTLNARETKTKREAVVKVMLALTEQNTRAGLLTLKDIKGKLKGLVSEHEVEEVIAWLQSSDVRLVTPFQEKAGTLYELAHERIIAPLHRMASQEISDVEKAEQLLDRRFNEWLGNDRSRRYLLRFKEWRLINRYGSFLAMNKQVEQKRVFISKSKRILVQNSVLFLCTAFLAITYYIGYQVYENRPETQLNKALVKITELLEKNQGDSPTQNALLTFKIFLPPSKNLRPLNNLTDDAIELSIADVYLRLGDNFQSNLILEKLESTSDPESAISVAGRYTRMGEYGRAIACLNRVFGRTLYRANTLRDFLFGIREDFLNRGNYNESLSLLRRAESLYTERAVHDTSESIYDKNKVLRSLIAEIYLMLGKRQEAFSYLEACWKSSQNPFYFPKDYTDLETVNLPFKGQLLRPDTFEDRVKFLISSYESKNARQKNIEYGEDLDEAVLMNEVLANLSKSKSLLKGPNLEYVEFSFDTFSFMFDGLIRLRREEKARGLLKETIELFFRDRSTRYFLNVRGIVNACKKLSLKNEAISFLKKMEESLAEYPSEEVNAKAFIASSYLEFGEREEASRLINSMDGIEMKAIYSENHLALAKAYSELGNNNQAINILNKGLWYVAFKEDNKRGPELMKFAISYAKLGYWKKAGDVAQSINLEAYQIMALSRIAAIQISREKFDQVEELFWDNNQEDE